MNSWRQSSYRIRCERGERGLAAIAADAAIVIVVDVLTFTTAVDVALSAGARVMPVTRDVDHVGEAGRLGARYAVPRAQRSEATPYTLSPHTLAALPEAARLVLPSPNGATLVARARESGSATIVGACLRNASPVAAFVRDHARGGVVALVPAGERWADDSLRPALEDDLGAGAILAALDLAAASPEAASLAAAFVHARADLETLVRTCATGRELTDAGYESDVDFAAQFDCSRTVPVLGTDGFFINAG